MTDTVTDGRKKLEFIGTDIINPLNFELNILKSIMIENTIVTFLQLMLDLVHEFSKLIHRILLYP